MRLILYMFIFVFAVAVEFGHCQPDDAAKKTMDDLDKALSKSTNNDIKKRTPDEEFTKQKSKNAPRPKKVSEEECERLLSVANSAFTKMEKPMDILKMYQKVIDSCPPCSDASYMSVKQSVHIYKNFSPYRSEETTNNAVLKLLYGEKARCEKVKAGLLKEK